jgi:hypothetical protein
MAGSVDELASAANVGGRSRQFFLAPRSWRHARSPAYVFKVESLVHVLEDGLMKCNSIRVILGLAVACATLLVASQAEARLFGSRGGHGSFGGWGNRHGSNGGWGRHNSCESSCSNSCQSSCESAPVEEASCGCEESSCGSESSCGCDNGCGHRGLFRRHRGGRNNGCGGGCDSGCSSGCNSGCGSNGGCGGEVVVEGDAGASHEAAAPEAPAEAAPAAPADAAPAPPGA